MHNSQSADRCPPIAGPSPAGTLLIVHTSPLLPDFQNSTLFSKDEPYLRLANEELRLLVINDEIMHLYKLTSGMILKVYMDAANTTLDAAGLPTGNINVVCLEVSCAAATVRKQSACTLLLAVTLGHGSR